jgi:hypothetical protein
MLNLLLDYLAVVILEVYFQLLLLLVIRHNHKLHLLILLKVLLHILIHLHLLLQM